MRGYFGVDLPPNRKNGENNGVNSPLFENLIQREVKTLDLVPFGGGVRYRER